jgi:hypothetical protein
LKLAIYSSDELSDTFYQAGTNYNKNDVLTVYSEPIQSTLDVIRTRDRRIRNPLLYPAELRGQDFVSFFINDWQCFLPVNFGFNILVRLFVRLYDGR